MNEAAYQRKLIKKLKKLFPDAMFLRTDPSHLQGIPDWVILFDKFWAALEIKIDAGARVQPNQKHYVERMDEMSYAAFIHPGNEEEVLSELQQTFGSGR